jgi:hypothetical protein
VLLTKAFLSVYRELIFPEVDVVKDPNWFELIQFHELPLAEKRNLLQARRQTLVEQSELMQKGRIIFERVPTLASCSE